MRHRPARSQRTVLLVLAAASLAGCQGSPLADVTRPGIGPGPEVTATARATSAPPTATPATAAPDQETLDEQLREAAWLGDAETAGTLIEQGADVNAKDTGRESAYLIATSEGHLELLRLTLAHGALVDDKDSWNGTGLIRAAERGHFLVVGELLQAGVDRDHVNTIGYQAVHEAVWLGEDTPAYRATLRVLAAGGVVLDRPSGAEGLTPLAMARERDYPGLEKVLTAVTDDSRIEDPGATLLAAAEGGDADLVARALRAGADLEVRDGQGRTALLLAAAGDHVQAAHVLVALGADPDAVDDRQDTPWLVTGVTGSVAMLEALLPARPDLTITNRFGGTSIIPASDRGHVDYVRRVVATGIDVDHVNDLGWTALLEAVILGDGGPRHQQVVEALLDAGADPQIADRDGVTALEHARSRGYDEIARLLEG